MFSYRRLRPAAFATLSHSINNARPALSLSCTPDKSITAAWPWAMASLPACNSAVTVVKCNTPMTRERSACTSNAAVADVFLNRRSSLRAGGAAGSHPTFGFHPLNYLVQSFLLNLGGEVGAEALHVGDACNHDIPGFPSIRCLVQAEIHRHLLARGAL